MLLQATVFITTSFHKFIVMPQHPDTVGGAMISGLREANRMLALMRDGDEDAAAALDAGLVKVVSTCPYICFRAPLLHFLMTTFASLMLAPLRNRYVAAALDAGRIKVC